MSRIGARAAGLAILVLGTVSAARAQTAEERARIERLERRLEELVARRVTADNAAEVRHDTLRVGSILILTDSAASPMLQEALRDLEGTLRRGLGTQPIPLLTGTVIVVRFGPASPAWGRLIADGAQFVQIRSGATTPQRLSAQIAHSVRTALGLRGGVTTWRADLRLFEDPEPLWEAMYIEMAATSRPGHRPCYEGDLPTCRYLLRLTGDTTPITAGVTAGLGAYVEARFRGRANQPALAPSYAACVERNDPDACVTFLDLVGAEVPTMSGRAAGTVLLAARDLGGDGALARFFADTAASIASRVEAAADAPLDSVLGAWHATILAHRPVETTIAAGTQWLALVWTIVLTVIATRSTRWR